MAYDEDLARRIRAVIPRVCEVTEQKMFGGLAFLLNGNMAVSASGKGGLLLRVDPLETDALVLREGAARFEMRGRQMDAWLHVDPSVIATDEDLERWVAVGLDYAGSLPPK